ncbi:MAG: transposase [Clostridiales bacterium]|nr:transposase [Clostridiales bacterium]
MSSIVTNKIGKYTYIYESESYRDENGKPQTIKTPIGKIDLKTGLPIYRPEYLEQTQSLKKQPDISDRQTFTVNDIKQSQILEYGLFNLLDKISEQIGINIVIKDAFPDLWESILTLVFYIVATGEPAMYCEDWITKNESYDCGAMSSQRISEMLIKITNEQRNDFYEKWGSFRNEREYFALDITSVSSYSELINDVEWGYNRDKEKLPQINICMLLGEKSKLPVFQTVYSGSLKDVSTLKTTLQTASHLNLRNMSIVMDKGFCSTKNINAMCKKDESIRFLIAMPFSHKFAGQQVENERNGINSVENTITIGSDIVRGVSRTRFWNANTQLYVHIFLNAEQSEHIKNKLYGYVSTLRDEAVSNPNDMKKIKEFNKYLVMPKSGETGGEVKIRNDVVENELKSAGWLVCVSNHVETSKEAIQIYRTKDVVEKGFLHLKNCLDLARLRVHSDNAMQNKVFIGFIALIFTAHIHKIMSENNLYRTMTMKKMIKTLESLRVQYIKGNRIYFPLTKTQKTIYKVFGLL